MITLGACAVFYSWALFILLPGSMLMLLLLPLWLVLAIGITKIMNRRGWRIWITAWQRWLFWLLVVLLIVLAPVYSYYYGYYYTTRIFKGLGIEAREIKRYPDLLDRFGDIGVERGFGIRYEVLEPLDEAKAKIVKHLGNRPDWIVAGPNPNALYPVLIDGRCTTSRYFGLINQYNFPIVKTGVSLFESGHLGVGFVYEQPRSCTDIQ